MAKQKNTPVSFSAEENAQAQQVFEHYHQLADTLHESKDQPEAETVLARINTLPEGAQFALLKTLAKENHVDAADLLLALNELSPLKSVRKEAKRALIQLSGAKIYPQWQAPINRAPAITAVALSTNPPRFWKGFVTDSMDAGEVQLVLAWEQGDNYKEVRFFGFLLEFWTQGVKDFFTEVESKRSFENLVARMKASMPDVSLKECTLAQGYRLVQKALDINKGRGITLPKDYRFNQSLINQLLLEVPDLTVLSSDEVLALDNGLPFDDDDFLVDDEGNEALDLDSLQPAGLVTTFVELWSDREYGVVYDLLAQNSPLRAGLAKDEWVTRRYEWAERAEPAALEPGFFKEYEQQKPRLWLPGPLKANRQQQTGIEIEAGWSLELAEMPDDALPELPRATTAYEETGRRWFWARYILVQEDNHWRIQDIIDEGARVQSLSLEEIQKKDQEFKKIVDAFRQKYMPGAQMQLQDTEEAQQHLMELATEAMQAVYYTDALVKKLPLDSSMYETAAARALTVGQYELCLVYLNERVQRFPDRHAQYFQDIAQIQLQLSEKYFDEEDDTRAERYQELAERALRASLAIENSFDTHLSLVHLLIEQERYDEAEDHLRQATPLASDSGDEAHIEQHLGEIATERKQYKEALRHYQRVVDLQPTSAHGWAALADTHEALGNREEVEQDYQRAIELDPEYVEVYYALSKLYLDNHQTEKAAELLERGVAANPDNALLHISLAGMYIQIGDYPQAERSLDTAERLDPDAELIPAFRQILATQQPQLAPIANRPHRAARGKKGKH